jgi:hypothetical protein
MGIGQENHCEMFFPRQFQESSNSLLHFLIVSWEVPPLGDPPSLTAVGVMRMTRWGGSTEVPMEKVEDPFGEQDALV